MAIIIIRNTDVTCPSLQYVAIWFLDKLILVLIKIEWEQMVNM